ncbi:hypothetical protein PINS_up012264 [Pythium insidiosum]|nr:hypothetical protein PINS_up012264 [Pythium insidiosum]
MADSVRRRVIATCDPIHVGAPVKTVMYQWNVDRAAATAVATALSLLTVVTRVVDAPRVLHVGAAQRLGKIAITPNNKGNDVTTRVRSPARSSQPFDVTKIQAPSRGASTPARKSTCAEILTCSRLLKTRHLIPYMANGDKEVVTKKGSVVMMLLNKKTKKKEERLLEDVYHTPNAKPQHHISGLSPAKGWR